MGRPIRVSLTKNFSYCHEEAGILENLLFRFIILLYYSSTWPPIKILKAENNYSKTKEKMQM